METKKVPQSIFQISAYHATIYGVISILANLAISLVPAETRESMGMGYALFSLVMSIGVVILVMNLACQAYKEANDGYMPFNQGMTMAMWVALLGSAINTVWSYVYLYFINPSLLKDELNKMRLELEKRDIAEEVMNKQMEWVEFFMSPIINLPITFAFMFILVFVVGLIAVGIKQKEKEHPF